MIFCRKQRYEKKKKKTFTGEYDFISGVRLRELLNKANIYFVNTKSVGLPG